MFFALQREEGHMDLEVFIVRDILDHNRVTDEYSYFSAEDFAPGILHPKYMRKAIPVGSIQFVEAYLNNQHEIDHIVPIEIPPILRKEKFLKRKYEIVSYKDIPKDGRFFLKDVSRLKIFSGEVNGKELRTEMNGILNPEHQYQVSEIIAIQSEYRVYVQDDKVECIANYNGDPCLFPDAGLIQEAILLYSTQNRPGAYTMDVAVNERGTFLLEIHPWISVGLYNSLWNRKLLYAYREGLDFAKSSSNLR